MGLHALVPYFDPQVWDPIIIAITAIFGPISQLLAPLAAGALTVLGSV